MVDIGTQPDVQDPFCGHVRNNLRLPLNERSQYPRYIPVFLCFTYFDQGSSASEAELTDECTPSREHLAETKDNVCTKMIGINQR